MRVKAPSWSYLNPNIFESIFHLQRHRYSKMYNWAHRTRWRSLLNTYQLYSALVVTILNIVQRSPCAPLSAADLPSGLHGSHRTPAQAEHKLGSRYHRHWRVNLSINLVLKSYLSNAACYQSKQCMAKQNLPWPQQLCGQAANRIRSSLQVRLPNDTIIFARVTAIYTLQTRSCREIKRKLYPISQPLHLLRSPSYAETTAGNLIEL